MSRRFTLFAILTAVCLLFSSCGALLLKAPASNKGSIVIPLRSSDRKANSPSELCTRFVFTIENADFKDTAEGTSVIEFKEIPFGTYTLTGTAYGKLSDEAEAPEEVVATCKVENLVINSPEPKAVTATFILSEATLIYFKGFTVEEPNPQGGAPITVTYTGTDKKTKLSETVTTKDEGTTTTTIREYAIDADGNNLKEAGGILFVAKETKTEPQSSGDKITVTEWDYNEGTPIVSKETVTEPDGKKTINEYNLDSSQGCEKRVTVEDGNTTTVEKFDSNEAETPTEKVVTTVEPTETTILTYDQSDMAQPASKKVIESTKTTTTEFYASDKTKTAAVTEEITAGANKGQKTVTEFNTSSGNPMRETVTSPDNHKTISEYNTAGTTKTTYQTDWVPGAGGSSTATDPDKNHIAKQIEEVTEGTKTTEFKYFSTKTTIDENGGEIPPYSEQTIYITNGDTTISKRVITYAYDYTTTEGKSRPTNISTKDEAGVEVAFERYSYDEEGRPKTVATLVEGGTAEYYAFKAINLVVYSVSSYISNLESVETDNIIFTSVGNDTFFRCPSNETFSTYNTSEITKEQIAQYLTDHYVLVGDSIATTAGGTEDLHWITTNELAKAKKDPVKGTTGFKYIFKVNFDPTTGFLKSSCFQKASDIANINGELTLKCYCHNEKASCTNFWGGSKNFSTANYIIKDYNYGNVSQTEDPTYWGHDDGI